MPDLDFSYFYLFYVVSGLLLVVGLWVYYDRRDKQLYEGQRLLVIFHCVRCGKIYTAKGTHEEAPCPECRFNNGRLKF